MPVPAFTRATALRRDAAAAAQLFRVHRTLRLDVIHTHTPKAGVIGRFVGRVARVPIVVNTQHGLWSTGAPVVAVESVAARLSDYELFQNAEDRRRLGWAVRDDRARVVGNGIDLARFRFDPDGRAKVRAELGVEDAELLVGGVGRRVAEKGVGELVTVAGRLREQARFVWVGPGDDSKRDAVRDVLGDVRFVAERDDMPAVYSAFDVFVLPSHREGFSRSAMEAAACGRPMVLSDIRGCREIGTAGEHLLLVPPKDAAALEAALRRLLGDPGLRRRLGVAAEARARAEFDQRSVAEDSLSIYAEVARRKNLAWG